MVHDSIGGVAVCICVFVSPGCVVVQVCISFARVRLCLSSSDGGIRQMACLSSTWLGLSVSV